ncbi:DUF3052 domain-containing protein [Kocuria sp. M1R5S2]|uniref:DUF3052 domain-containing protein n=1 Tax=Kocuria rhizosphaerae TaxID=3376285 RepID=UPI0037B178CF
MSEAQTTAGDAVVQLGFKDGYYIQEFGYDEDVDLDLRERIEDLTGNDLLDEEDQEVADAVLLWFRDGDGDLVDTLVDVQTTLDDGGVVWVLTPKAGRDGYVAPAEVQEAAPTAGLHVTTSARVSADWAATRLMPKRNI